MICFVARRAQKKPPPIACLNTWNCIAKCWAARQDGFSVLRSGICSVANAVFSYRARQPHCHPHQAILIPSVTPRSDCCFFYSLYPSIPRFFPSLSVALLLINPYITRQCHTQWCKWCVYIVRWWTAADRRHNYFRNVSHNYHMRAQQIFLSDIVSVCFSFHM